MEALIYSLLKEKKTDELITEINRNRELLYFSDSEGVSLLMLSFYFRNNVLSDFILSQRNPKDIYEASAAGTTGILITFLKNNPELLNSHSPDGFTPLGLASYFGRMEIVRILLENGADPNIAASNSFRVAPLHSSVAANHYEITKSLLDYGANPNAKQQNDFTPLHSAAHLANANLVQLLLQHGAEKDARTDNKKTPLDIAKEANAQEVISLLQ